MDLTICMCELEGFSHKFFSFTKLETITSQFVIFTLNLPSFMSVIYAKSALFNQVVTIFQPTSK